MSKIYRVTLQPLDWFFFGGETTLQNSKKDKNGKEKEKYIYFAHSNYMPQQTSLLGMLRYQLLKQNNLLENNNDINSTKALIGDESFSMRKMGQSFGKIRQLSPVFVTDGNANFFPMPLSSSYTPKEDTFKVGFNGSKKECAICFDDFNEKKYNNYLKWKGNNGEELFLYDLFETNIKIGITKPRDNGEPDEEAFFKLEMCRFRIDMKNKKRKFCFFVEMDDSEKLINDNVFLGAERSCFSMIVEDTKVYKSITDAYLSAMGQAKPEPSENGIILLSPTFVPDIDKLNNLLLFHWSYPMSFRNLEMTPSSSSSKNTASTSNIKTLDSGGVKYRRYNIKYNMLCAGSHLFPSQGKMDETKKLLDNINLQNIGYNLYL